MSQQLRRSQFITIYGPGAILESRQGPRMIPAIEHSSLFTGRNDPQKVEITDATLSRALLGGARIFRIPSNAEQGKHEESVLYRTSGFPGWSLCPLHGILYRYANGTKTACPICDPFTGNDAESQARTQARSQAIRFIIACPAGHLDDVYWTGIIEHYRPGCAPTYLKWIGGGGALRNVEIVCPECNARIGLNEAYGRSYRCSGRYPEREGARNASRFYDCQESAQIVQRGASNLRISELKTALTIPPRSTPLHRILERHAVRAAITVSQKPSTKDQLLEMLRKLSDERFLSNLVVTEIANLDESEILRAIDDTFDKSTPRTPLELRLEEFRALRKAADQGAPAVPHNQSGLPDQFEVIRDQVRVVNVTPKLAFRVTPVNRLRVVMVQTGYRRLDPLNAVVDCAFNFEEQPWYPGLELFGEGIFMDLPLENEQWHFDLREESASTWYNAWNNPNSLNFQSDSDERVQLHPVFVWWHTLAHRLINALAIDSGYSSAAVRERIFIETDDLSSRARGGVLLYTVQPGGDGTLGGLIALVPQFERVLRTAFRNLDVCSNDPLCGREKFSSGKVNGAACYACSLISETSCEHRNMRLDRNILLENLP